MQSFIYFLSRVIRENVQYLMITGSISARQSTDYKRYKPGKRFVGSVFYKQIYLREVEGSKAYVLVESTSQRFDQIVNCIKF